MDTCVHGRPRLEVHRNPQLMFVLISMLSLCAFVFEFVHDIVPRLRVHAGSSFVWYIIMLTWYAEKYQSSCALDQYVCDPYEEREDKCEYANSLPGEAESEDESEVECTDTRPRKLRRRSRSC